MTQKKNQITQIFSRTALLIAMLVGAGIALITILFFITGVDSPPEWPDLWKLRPLILTPLAGAFGGALFYLVDHLLEKAGLNKIISVFLGILVFSVVLWLGIVLGLDGTLWN